MKRKLIRRSHIFHLIKQFNTIYISSLILTDKERILLTPTYHVFKMYKVHQEANLEIKQITDYPWDGKIRFELKSDKSFHSTFKFRIPAWCTHYSLSYNGQIQEVTPSLGYASLSRKWKDGDVVELDLEMPVQVLSADPRVKANVGKRAIQRGPLVYCLEEIDNPQIDDAVIEPNMHFTTVRNDLLDIVEIRGVTNGQVLKFVPYYIWDNREAGKMKVWIDASL